MNRPFALVPLLALTACAVAPSHSVLDEVPRAERFDVAVAGTPAAPLPRVTATETVAESAAEPAEFVPQGDPAMADRTYSDSGGFALGLGSTFDPSMLLIGGTLELPAGNDVYWGPAVEIGVSDEKTLFSAVLHGKYVLGAVDDEEKRISPFIQSGLGFVVYDRDGASAETSLLLNAGGGVRFDLDGPMKLGTLLLLNWAPGEVLGEHTYVSWEIAQLVIPF